ncbi:MAG: MoaD family protein [Candidatus Bathyarchaeota archaeon]|nr:MAG: MoaD family protein [Candidatus Bathyarchaeota archaeon]
MKPPRSQVHIKLFAMFKETAGQKEIIHPIKPDTALRTLLESLAVKYGGDFNETIDHETGQVDVNTLVMLNGRTIRNLGTKLKDNDLLVITVPAAGG